MNFFSNTKKYLHDRPKIKKGVGIFLILIGLLALVTPLTPGAWIAIVGIELLGIRIAFLEKFKFWKKNNPPTIPE